MKNLKLYSKVALRLELQHPEDGESLLFSAVDIESNRLFFASSFNIIYGIPISCFQIGGVWGTTKLPAKAYPIELEDGDRITSFDYLMEKESLLVGTSKGLLLLFNVDENSSEVVGQVEGGVTCIAPSPDGDLVAIVSGFAQLLVLTRDWDPLQEIALEEKQTDFHVQGSTIRVGESYMLPLKYSDACISWRGDGKYFTTLSMSAGSFTKRIKIWERDSSALHATSDQNPFMGTVVEWMPSGAKIAAVIDRKEHSKCPEITFYERNGLARGSFDVNESSDVTIEALKWNCNSDLLAIVVKCDGHDSVKVWSFRNSHWYLKHESRYPKRNEVKIMWDVVNPLQLFCWSCGAQITLLKFSWVSAMISDSTAFVIDDSKILVSLLSLALMPPPLSLFCFKFPSPVQSISSITRNSRIQLAATLSNGCLCTILLPEEEMLEELEGGELEIELCNSDAFLGFFVHHIWLDSHRILAISHFPPGYSDTISCHSFTENGFYLLELELTCFEDNTPSLLQSSGWHAKVTFSIKLEEQVIAIASNPAKKCSAIVQLDGGQVLEYTSNSGLKVPVLDMSFGLTNFLSSCPQMCLTLVGDDGSIKGLLFGLDNFGRLQVQGKIISTNCRCFTFYSSGHGYQKTHLIVLTNQDFLSILDINDIQFVESGSKPENFILSGSNRKGSENNLITVWERGAEIIGVLNGDDASIILQTTRGNLECIYPRKLVLSSIANALLQERFKDSLLMVRRHRIDFNVIVDLCGWKKFIQSASMFVKEVNNLAYLTEFICAIKGLDIIELSYKKYIPFSYKSSEGRPNMDEIENGKKVSAILFAIRKGLEEHVLESPARELCILTTLARSDPPLLEEALERIRDTRDMEITGCKRSSYPSAEEALKHLLWLSDPDAVFQAALGLYDLNLAAIVALNSQKDPKEFLPYLQELQQMSSPVMYYNIDLKLGRHENALKHIISAGDSYFPECMQLLNRNPETFPLGLQLITDPIHRRQVVEAWGDHLTDKKQFDEAAGAFLSCNNLNKASKAYRVSGNWRGVLTVAGFLTMGTEAIANLAHELSEELQEMGKPAEAAKIALEYCCDVNRGINLLICSRDWEEALRVAHMHRREDLLTEVKNASIDCANQLICDYEEGLEKVGKYLARYVAVRQRRLLLKAKLQSNEQSINDVDCDLISETSSNFSGMSVYTTGKRSGSAASVTSIASSRTRSFRQQKKRGKIRPGSPGEEIGLVEHLKGMSLTSGTMRELKSLLVSLLMVGMEETARKLQRVVEQFQLAQMAAVRLADDTVSSTEINEAAHTMDQYVKKILAEPRDSLAFSWQLKVLITS